ncbi:MAG: LysR family transcriptional regulator [Rhodospirillales bacterium]|nr:LysR family transcriptional regulator [Rhodospirillales bacterium]
MEMHQIRYFLALSETLNFTHAAERCNVTQPALTRAIHALEAELGGELLRRERALSHLTELGQRMLPLIRQCYESALAVQSMAHSISKGESAPLSLAVSQTVALALVTSMLKEVTRAFPGLQLKLLRGSGGEVVEWLKSGEVELAIAGPLRDSWSRLDAYELFDEPFDLFVGRSHKLAGKNMADAGDIASETLLLNADCEMTDVLGNRLTMGVGMGRFHHVATLHDLLILIEANLGVAILPVGGARSGGVKRVPLAGLDLMRKVSVYCAAGRRRSHACTTLLNMLRAADWQAGPPTERSWGVH